MLINSFKQAFKHSFGSTFEVDQCCKKEQIVLQKSEYIPRTSVGKKIRDFELISTVSKPDKVEVCSLPMIEAVTSHNSEF